MRPSLATTTQSETVGQETPRNSNGSPSSIDFHAARPPVGSVEVKILPWSSRLPETATQRETVGQETPKRWVFRPWPSIWIEFQADDGPVGLVEV